MEPDPSKQLSETSNPYITREAKECCWRGPPAQGTGGAVWSYLPSPAWGETQMGFTHMALSRPSTVSLLRWVDWEWQAWSFSACHFPPAHRGCSTQDLDKGMMAYSWDPGDVPRPSLVPRGRKNSERTEMRLCAGGGCILSITGNGVGGRAACVALEMAAGHGTSVLS